MQVSAAAPAMSGTGGSGLYAVPADRTHAVQFYEGDDFLGSVVADFLAAGLSRRQPAVVVATEPHRAACLTHLGSKGFDVADLCRSGQLTLRDARETLATFMVAGLPDAARFQAAVGSVIEARHRGGDTVVVYGDMVDVLWEEGNPEGALQLETLWNELATRHSFSLLCAYALQNFSSSSHADAFLEVCRQHDHVVPTERYTQADEANRLLEISVLQQRAHALETEVAYRRELEKQLREALAERERLLEREHAAREAADAANRAKSDFLAAMSHELRTPLNAIAGYAELLVLGVHGPISERQRDAVERIQLSERHLLGVIDEVLSFARVDAGQVRYVITDIAMDELLRSADLCIFPQMRAKGLEYTYSACDPAITARGDGEKVHQIVLNLLANATKFTEAGGQIRLECEAAGSEVRVRVNDTGIGIAPEQLDAIFQPFVQVDTGLARVYEGVGLGLAISREYARGMGGDLSATSVPGEGATFTLTLRRGTKEA